MPAVSVLDLHKSFGKTKVLNGVSMVSPNHEVVAIIGSSGSGKSTLLRCINLLELPDRGEIRIKDELLRLHTNWRGHICPDKAQIQRLRRHLGMVFQNYNLWSHKTLLENVIEAPIHVLGKKRAEAIEEGEALLEKVGIFDKRHAYPAFVSGGQKQRAAIARALAMEPQIMLFDEPTSALDPELVGEVLAVIRTLAEEGRTMLMVTHELHFARDVADEVLYIDNGKIAEQGPPEQVLVAPESESCQRFLNRFLEG